MNGSGILFFSIIAEYPKYTHVKYVALSGLLHGVHVSKESTARYLNIEIMLCLVHECGIQTCIWV